MMDVMSVTMSVIEPTHSIQNSLQKMSERESVDNNHQYKYGDFCQG